MSIRFRKFGLGSTDAMGEAGNGSSRFPYFSPDGENLLFESRATNLAPDDANGGTSDIFLKDLVTGDIVQVSTNANGVGGNAISVIALAVPLASPFSPDGEKVLFWSLASNLVAGDRNFGLDLFMKNLETGEVTLITQTAEGLQGRGGSLYGGSFSPDGGSVLFDSSAAFVPVDHNGGSDVFIKDLATGDIMRVSTLAGGGEANGDSYGAVFSPDGTKVLFSSDADNFVAGDINGQTDVYLKDLRTGVVTLVSRTSAGGSADSLSLAMGFSPDGDQVLFTSLASNMVAGDTNGAADLFTYDIASGRVARVSTDSNGHQLASAQSYGQFTPDGAGIVFTSATNNSSVDVFFKDLRTEEVALVSRGIDGEPATGFVQGFALSPDGLGIAFSTDAVNLVNDPPSLGQIYLGPVRAPLPLVRGTTGADTLAGTAAAEALRGLAGNDVLIGRGGSDELNGGPGADSMRGGYGHDLYIVNSTADRAIEGRNAGLDTVQSSASFMLGSNLERLVLVGSRAINGRGNAGANEIVGNVAANALSGGNGADVLDGGRGADRMAGGAGNDHYFVERRTDFVTEAVGNGIDTVTSTVSYRLSANVERLELAGAGELNGIGNGLANVITGNDADNILDGRGGGDRLIGGYGDDLFIVDSARDRIVEGLSGGTDRVRSSANHVLAPHVENLILAGSARAGAGNSLDNQINGNSVANLLTGRVGDDILTGRGGNDRLNGGLGNDRMSGGGGADIFYFDEEPGRLGGVDRITDFTPGTDRIGLDRSIFDAIADNGRLSTAAFAHGTARDADDRIVYQPATGRIFYDADGSGSELAVLVGQVTGGLDLSPSDFFVYG